MVVCPRVAFRSAVASLASWCWRSGRGQGRGVKMLRLRCLVSVCLSTVCTLPSSSVAHFLAFFFSLKNKKNPLLARRPAHSLTLQSGSIHSSNGKPGGSEPSESSLSSLLSWRKKWHVKGVSHIHVYIFTYTYIHIHMYTYTHIYINIYIYS